MANVGITDHPFGTGFAVERALLEPLGAKLTLASSTTEAALTEMAASSDALLVCYAPIPRSVVEAAAGAGCRVISRYGIGYDNVDVIAATEAGITVTNVPDYCLDEVADHTLALLLALARGIGPATANVRRGGWAPDSKVHSLRGRTLALVGLGRIGTKTAERALAFGLRVVAFDPFVNSSPSDGIELAGSLTEAIAEADCVSLHVPMSADNRHLICDETIAAMRNSPLLVNTSRGGLVDLEAVVRALDSGALSGVALDVTEPEPLPEDHPLRTDDRAIITPHMAFYSEEAQVELQRRAAEEVARALRHEPPRSPVNPEVLTR